MDFQTYLYLIPATFMPMQSVPIPVCLSTFFIGAKNQQKTKFFLSLLLSLLILLLHSFSTANLIGIGKLPLHNPSLLSFGSNFLYSQKYTGTYTCSGFGYSKLFPGAEVVGISFLYTYIQVNLYRVSQQSFTGPKTFEYFTSKFCIKLIDVMHYCTRLTKINQF